MGYVTKSKLSNQRTWVCEKCYLDFKEEFDFIDETHLLFKQDEEDGLVISETTLLSELLYIISNHRKSAITTNWWSAQRNKDLLHSLTVMDDILTYLLSNKQGQSKSELFLRLLEYWNEYGSDIMEESSAKAVCHILTEKNTAFEKVSDREYCLLFYMKLCISIAKSQLFGIKNTSRKNNIKHCLYALHNLSKAMLKGDDGIILNLKPQNFYDALNYALDEMDNLRL